MHKTGNWELELFATVGLFALSTFQKVFVHYKVMWGD